MRKGEGRGGDGVVKMFRSSSKNLEGPAASVITSSISSNLSSSHSDDAPLFLICFASSMCLRLCSRDFH